MTINLSTYLQSSGAPLPLSVSLGGTGSSSATGTGLTVLASGPTLATPTLTTPAINGVVTTTGLTLPAFTLGGAVTGGGQNVSGLGTLGCGAITSSDTLTLDAVSAKYAYFKVSGTSYLQVGGNSGGSVFDTVAAGNPHRFYVGGTEVFRMAATALTLGSGITSISGGTNPSLNIGTGALTAGSGTFSSPVTITCNTSAVGVAVKANAAQPNYAGLVFYGSDGVTQTGAVSTDSALGKLRMTVGSTEIGYFSSTGLSLGSLGLTAGAANISAANVAGMAVSARYNTSNAPIALLIENSGGSGYLGFNVQSKLSSNTATFDQTGVGGWRLHTGLVNHIVASVASTSGTAGADVTWVDVLDVSSTGLSVTGTLSSTGTISYLGTSSSSVLLKRTDAMTTGTRAGIDFDNSASSTVAAIRVNAITDNVGSEMDFFTRPAAGSLTKRMTLDSSGNLGVGVTPSAWANGWTAIQRNRANLAFSGTGANQATVLVDNAFLTGSGASLLTATYQSTDYAAMYRMHVGAHDFFTAPSGTAAAAVTFTKQFTIDVSGNAIVVGGGGVGYGAGSGGSVTQTTSRTTGVTLDKTNGAITLVSAAGSTSWQSFTVTNNKVAVTDVIHVCQRSGTDLNEIHVTNVAAGSFRISFRTTAGTTTEQPVFSFAVIKAVTG